MHVAYIMEQSIQSLSIGTVGYGRQTEETACPTVVCVSAVTEMDYTTSLCIYFTFRRVSVKREASNTSLTYVALIKLFMI